MKKTLLSLALLLGLGQLPAAHAQVNLIRMGINSAILAKRLSKGKDGAATEAPTVAPTGSYEGKTFPMQRTPANQLPRKGAEPIVAMETELDRCHAALSASPTATICTPEQRAAIQTAIVNLARAGSSKNLAAYQQEATFYLAEDARRQQAAGPAGAAK